MAWRPTQYLIKGELDNTERHKVTGWMEFLGLESRVTFDLHGEFHRDIRGAKIEFYGLGGQTANARKAAEYFNGFATHQTGKVGDITAGLPPRDYSDYPYIEWYSDQNGRVVLELDPKQLAVIGTPIPASESDPISTQERHDNMKEFLRQMRDELRGNSKSNNQYRRPPIRPGDQPPHE